MEEGAVVADVSAVQENLVLLLVVPAPFLLKVAMQEGDAPAGFFLDLLEDLEDFFLLAADGQAFSSYGEAADGG